MALIQCPECGQMVSDRAGKCVNCGYPLEQDTETEVNESTVSEKAEAEELTEAVETAALPESAAKTIDKKKLIPIAAVAAVVVLALVIAIGALGGKASVGSIEFSKWRLIEQGEYGDTYEGTLHSDETKPFVAVIGSYESEEAYPDFVYMNGGEGILEAYESDDPSVIYRPIGWMTGTAVTNADLRSVNYKDYDYMDLEFVDTTYCSLDITFELKNKQSGLLFFDLSDELTNEETRNCYVVIESGHGKYTELLHDVPLKSRGVELEIAVKYFCPAETVTENNFAISEEYSATKNSNSYSGSMELTFEGSPDGLVLVNKELTSGGDPDDVGIKQKSALFLHDETCEITTYDSVSDDKTILKPKYEFDVFGYLTWNTLE